MAESKNKKTKVIPIVIEGFEINAPNVTYQKLQEFTLTLYEKLLSQRKERSFLLMERDKLRTILENTRHETKVAEDIAMNKAKELEQVKERHKQQVKEVEDEVKYILYDHSLSLAELKLWEDGVLVKTDQENQSEELELLREKRRRKKDLDKAEQTLENELALLKNQHLEELMEQEKKLNEVQTENEIDFKRSFNNTVDQLTLKHEMEMSEVEERKNAHLAELKAIHKTRVDDTKNFFNSITVENLTVISNLRHSLEGIKKSKATMLAEVKHLKKENIKLKGPLEESKVDVRNLTRQLINYEKDLLSLKNNKRMLKQTVEDTRKLKKQTSAALKKIKGNDNVDLMTMMESSCLYSVKDFKTHVTKKRQRLEELVENLLQDLLKKQRLVKDLTSDPDVRQALEAMNFEFWNPKQLSYELAVICKAHDDLQNTLERKLEEFCIPENELGLDHLDVQFTGKRSAALVAKQ